MINRFNGNYAFLSNFHASPITYEGIQYPTAEHAFQAAKARTQEEKQYIAGLASPGLAKRAGRKVKLIENWDQKRVEIMTEIVRLKFTQNPELAQQLLDTGDDELIEGNTWGDTFWGVCDGVGFNHLGSILMQIRSELHRSK